jgi:hypothetical protein
MGSDWKRVVLLATPPLLLATTYAAFQILARLAGATEGYLGGFLFYWILWCLAVPAWVMGRRGMVDFFRKPDPPLPGRGRIIGIALGLPLLLGYGYAFPRVAAEASAAAVLLSAFLAVINGTLEELLWRGAYLSLFPESKLFGYWYPNLAFGIWHVAPLSVMPSREPGGTASFVLVSTVVGLLWGWVAFHTRSVRWTSAAHVLFDFSGLGGRVYFP